MKSIIEQKLTNASIGTGFPLALQTSSLRGRYATSAISEAPL